MNALKEKLKKIPFVLALYERYAETFRVPLDEVRKYKVYHYGKKNKDRKFFVISFKQGGREIMYSKMGIYSLTLCLVLPFVDYAVKRGWIPVIDLSGCYVPVIQDVDKMDSENSWEYYYEQPIKDVSLEEVYQSRHVLNAWYWRHKVMEPEWNHMLPAKKEDLAYWHKMIIRYIRLNKKLEDNLAIERKKLFSADCKVLGVGVRAGFRAGMMKNESLYNNHPKQPACEELINIVEEKMKKWKYESIFIACDDREYMNKFISYFGERCHYIERARLHYFQNDRPVIEAEEKIIERKGSTVRECIEEYVIETYLLAQCDSLYGCKGGGTEFAYFLNGGKFRHLEIYDKGIYTGLGE